MSNPVDDEGRNKFFQRHGFFPILSISSVVNVTTLGSVSGPAATSTKGMICGGANQWATTRRSGYFTRTISKMFSEDVLLARTVS